MLTILEGNCLTRLKEIPDASVQMCATSPPYYGLRDYGTGTWEGGDPECDHRPDPESVRSAVMAKSTIHVAADGNDAKQMDAAAARMMKSPCPKCGAYRVDDQIGLEKTPEDYIANLVAVFREVRRTLKNDGTLWMNLGDSYASTSTYNAPRTSGGEFGRVESPRQPNAGIPAGCKPKDLLMLPARVAIALQQDGWWLRSMIPWVKRQAMPESVEDRPNSSVEYVFLLSKSQDYFYDHVAVKMPAQSGPSDIKKMMEKKERIGGKHLIDDPGELAAANPSTNIGKRRGVGGTVAPGKNEESGLRRYDGFNERWDAKEAAGAGPKHTERMDPNGGSMTRHGDDIPTGMLRNWRNGDAFVDTLRGLLENEQGDPLAFLVNPQPYREAHFAVWPPRLVLPMILAGSRHGDTVLDPFLGSGTTAMVAIQNGRQAIGCELNANYVQLVRQRCETTVGLGF